MKLKFVEQKPLCMIGGKISLKMKVGASSRLLTYCGTQIEKLENLEY
nr:MAG TPA: hypothetical protein [Caudoviricetes sp.]